MMATRPMAPPQAGPVPMPAAATPGAPPLQDQGGYPSGGEIVAEQGQQQAAMSNTENPAIAAIRTIVQLVGQMKQNGDPRADQAIPALQQLIGAFTGSGEMQPPQGTMGGQQGQAAPPGPGMAPAGPPPAPMPAPGGPPGAAGGPPGAAGPMPGPAPAPGPEIVSEFEQPGTPAQPRKPVPMGRQQKPMGKQPMILT